MRTQRPDVALMRLRRQNGPRAGESADTRRPCARTRRRARPSVLPHGTPRAHPQRAADGPRASAHRRFAHRRRYGDVFPACGLTGAGRRDARSPLLCHRRGCRRPRHRVHDDRRRTAPRGRAPRHGRPGGGVSLIAYARRSRSKMLRVHVLDALLGRTTTDAWTPEDRGDLARIVDAIVRDAPRALVPLSRADRALIEVARGDASATEVVAAIARRRTAGRLETILPRQWWRGIRPGEHARALFALPGETRRNRAWLIPQQR